VAFALRVVAVPQSGTGALRIVVTDETGLPVAAAVHLRSDANRVHRDLETDDAGVSIARDLPFGAYELVVERDGFAPFSHVIEIRSALRTECRVTLAVAPVRTEVSVGGSDTLLDLGGTSTASRIGAQAIQSRMAAPPGRALPALVNTRPAAS